MDQETWGHDTHRRIETGASAWKNDAVAVYQFLQGPGATLAFIDPRSRRIIERTDALSLHLSEKRFLAEGGRTPKLQQTLLAVLAKLN